MTELERQALLGSAEAQKQCTEHGIILPCPWCGCDERDMIGLSVYHEQYFYSCEACGCNGPIVFDNDNCDYPQYDALKLWNTRPVSPICVQKVGVKMEYKNDLEMALKAAIFAINNSRNPITTFIDDIKGKNGGPYAIEYETVLNILAEQVQKIEDAKRWTPDEVAYAQCLEKLGIKVVARWCNTVYYGQDQHRMKAFPEGSFPSLEEGKLTKLEDIVLGGRTK